MAFRRLGLETLGRTDYVPPNDPRAERALALWDDGMTAKAAGAEVGLSQTIMTRLLRETGRRGQRRGEAHASWRGGRSKNDQGYITVYVDPDDPLAPMRNGDSRVMEHRVVMARHLGRPLASYETVHHKNAVRDDNRIENLQLRVGHHGQGAAMCCTDCGSTRIAVADL